MPILLDASDAVAVRAALGPQTDSGSVSDATILSNVYTIPATDMVLEWRDRYAPTVADDDPKLRLAVDLVIASKLVDGTGNLLSEKLPDYSYTRQASAPETLQDRSTRLLGEAYATVLRLGGIDADASARPDVFSTAPGGRGWLDARYPGPGLFV